MGLTICHATRRYSASATGGGQRTAQYRLDHVVPHEVFFETVFGRPIPSFAEARGSSSKRPIFSARSKGLPGSNSKPVNPSVTVYGNPPIRLAITGLPAAIASTDVMLRASWAIVGTSTISATR